MSQCDICEEMGVNDCKHCSLGNPCLGCVDYDEYNDTCKSNGGCAEIGESDDNIVRKEDRYTLHFRIAPDGNGTIFYNQTPQQVKTLEEEYSKNFRVKCVREERKDNKVEKDYMLYDKE